MLDRERSVTLPFRPFITLMTTIPHKSSEIDPFFIISLERLRDKKIRLRSAGTDAGIFEEEAE